MRWLKSVCIDFALQKQKKQLFYLDTKCILNSTQTIYTYEGKPTKLSSQIFDLDGFKC